MVLIVYPLMMAVTLKVNPFKVLMKIKENEAIVKNQIISKETSDKMRVLMEHGVTDGIVNKVPNNRGLLSLCSATRSHHDAPAFRWRGWHRC